MNIVYPVTYNINDESVEDGAYRVIAHPFTLPGESKTDRDQIGNLLAAALNALNDQAAHLNGKTIGNGYTVPADIREKMPSYMAGRLDRMERKHKKMVDKLMFKYKEA